MIQTRYAVLFQNELRHTYYGDGQARSIVAEPTPGCRQLLEQYGLVFRGARSSFAVYARVVPEASPPALFRGFGSDVVAFPFCLRLTNPYFHHVTSLPEHDGTHSVFYFDNLRDDRQGGRRYLGDSVADVRLAPPIRSAFGETYTYSFAAPVNGAHLVVRDIFGRDHLNVSFQLEETSDTVTSHQLNLRPLARPGRYVVTDNHGGREELYYDPSLYGSEVFGVVVIYNRTDLVTTDGRELVPAPYRFLDGDDVTEKGRYAVGFEPRSTVWRYIVTKKYETNGVRLGDLGIAGGIPFTSALDTERVVFTSDIEVPFDERPTPLTLEENGTTVRRLPHPRMNTPLQRATPTDPYRSDMYVYI